MVIEDEGGVYPKEAEVKCKSCGRTKWVSWDKRHAGNQEEEEQDLAIRCFSCRSGNDYTAYTGNMR